MAGTAPSSRPLTDDERRELLALARRAAAARVAGARPPGPSPAGLPAASGAFVSIKSRGELRGCLGTLSCSRGLAGEVVRCAGDAASEDPRFAPVAASELGDLRFEISVLGPLERLDPIDPVAIVVGCHGLVVEAAGRRGLLLPQVAVEWQWSAEEFLRRTCLKAGLAADAWRSGAAVYIFTADVFGE